MKMSETTLNILLAVSGLVSVLGTASAVYIGFKKNELAVTEKAAAKIQKALDGAELKNRHDKIEFLERENQLLLEKNHAEDVLNRKEIALLNEQHGNENRKILLGKMLGEKSKPVLHFGYFYELQEAYLFIKNDGDDPAYDVSGSFTYSAGDTINTGPYLRTEFGPINVPAKMYRIVVKPFKIGNGMEISIDAEFITRSGSVVHETLYVARHHRRSISEAYEITRTSSEGTLPPERYRSHDFPLDQFPDVAEKIKTWPTEEP